MSIRKQFSKSKPVCKVFFKVSKEMAAGASKVTLVGEFNDWNETADEFDALKDGSFSISINLKTGRSYQFRYLLDGSVWINDDAPDGYCYSGIGDSQNGIISL